MPLYTCYKVINYFILRTMAIGHLFYFIYRPRAV